jgi:hypothetical protein
MATNAGLAAVLVKFMRTMFVIEKAGVKRNSPIWSLSANRATRQDTNSPGSSSDLFRVWAAMSGDSKGSHNAALRGAREKKPGGLPSCVNDLAGGLDSQKRPRTRFTALGGVRAQPGV